MDLLYNIISTSFGGTMKKFVILILIAALLVSSACASDIVKNGGVVEHGSPLPTADVDDIDSDEIIVYVTESGSKYHTQDCSHLSNSKIPVTLSQAKQQGYEPCSVCEPPT
jgi:opacity protein-like surface antigen